jgi:hypothetical protein
MLSGIRREKEAPDGLDIVDDSTDLVENERRRYVTCPYAEFFGSE